MKKVFLSLALAAMAMAAVSCSEKEGAYAPKKQVAEIYSTSEEYLDNQLYDQMPRHLSQRFNWDGKQLSCIEIMDDNGASVECKETITYDSKKRIESISIVQDGRTMKSDYTYDGKHLDNIKIYEGSTFVGQYTFKHDGKKIVTIEQTSYNDFKAKTSTVEALRFVMDAPTAKLIDRTASKVRRTLREQGVKDAESIVFNLKWDGDNIASIDAAVPFLGSLTLSFSYDNKVNPFYNFIDIDGFNPVADTYGMFNKNNVTSITQSVPAWGINETMTNTYVYDGDYPTSVTFEEIGEAWDENDNVVTMTSRITNEYIYK